jgi:hypothetical protein
MNVTIIGTLFSISADEQVTDKFKKKECVIRVPAKDPKWDDYIKVEFQQSGCDMLSSFAVNDQVTVQAVVKGRKWEKEGKTMFFNTIVGINVAQNGASKPSKEMPAATDFIGNGTKEVKAKAIAQLPVDENDDLPF